MFNFIYYGKCNSFEFYGSAAADGDRPRDRRGGHKERREHLCGAGAGKDRSDSGDIPCRGCRAAADLCADIGTAEEKAISYPPGKLHKIFCKKLLTMSNERCILHASKDSDASEPVPGALSFTNLQAFESGQVMRGTHLQRVRGS